MSKPRALTHEQDKIVSHDIRNGSSETGNRNPRRSATGEILTKPWVIRTPSA